MEKYDNEEKGRRGCGLVSQTKLRVGKYGGACKTSPPPRPGGSAKPSGIRSQILTAYWNWLQVGMARPNRIRRQLVIISREPFKR